MTDPQRVSALDPDPDEDSDVDRSSGRHRGRHRKNWPEPEPESAPAPTPKGGRNMPAAIGVAVAMLVIAGAPLVFYRPAFVAVLAVAVGVGIWELTGAMRTVGVNPPFVPLVLGGAGSIALTWFTGPEALVIGLAVTVLAVLLWRFPDGPAGFGRDVMSATFIAAYVPFLAGFVVLLVMPEDGVLRTCAFVVTTACSDIGGLFVGRKFGRNKLAPLVSPGKTWEGALGAVLTCVVSGVAFLTFGLDGAWWQGVVFGAAVGAAAILGDLAESLVKRDLGVKDMGNLLPGHGGFMDRFDSLLVTAPVAYLLLTAFVPAG